MSAGLRISELGRAIPAFSADGKRGGARFPGSEPTAEIPVDEAGLLVTFTEWQRL
jgi:hypothetical protein